MSLLKTPTGKTMTSIIWGLGIAALFYLACKEGGCLVVKAPEDFDNGVYKFDRDCYKFSPYPVKCNAKEGFTPDIIQECGSYRYHNVPSHELPCDDKLEAISGLTGFEAPIETVRQTATCQNRDDFQHPHCLWNELRKAKNCGDSRHYRAASCYKHHPMDSIFRAPSSQLYLPQTRN